MIKKSGESGSRSLHWLLRVWVCALGVVLTSSPAWGACGPGPHWVATCPSGTDTFNITANIGTNTGITLTVSGQVKLYRGAPSGSTIPIEIVSMNLSGSALGGVTLTAGDGNGNLVSDGPFYSPGTITENASNPALATLTASVFFQVTAAGATLHNAGPYNAPGATPLILSSSITGVPPTLNSSAPVSIPLLNGTNQPSGITATSVTITGGGGGGGPGPAATISIVSGNNQTGTVGQPLANPFVVKVTDSNNNSVPGVSVTFTVTSGGGRLSNIASTTDSQGQASTTFILGPNPGANTVTATVGSVTPVTFTATGNTAKPTTISLVSGNNQAGTAGVPLASPFIVQVTDANNKPVPGVAVIFQITAGGGKFSGGGTSLTVNTDAQGQASTTLTLGPNPGTITVTASSTGLSGSPIIFAATSVNVPAGPPSKISVASGDNQTGTVGQPLLSPLTVMVTDSNNIPVAGVAVIFAVTAGGGTLSATQATTDPSGQASTVLTLGPNPEPNTVTASSPAVGGLITFTATGSLLPTAGAATTIAAVSGSNQTAATGQPLANPFVVVVTGDNSQPAPGIPVTFLVTWGGGSLTGALTRYTVNTDAQGQASVLLTLGLNPGVNSVVALSGTLIGSPVTFIAFGTSVVAGSPTTFSMVSGNNQTGTVGTALTSPSVVKVTDANTIPIPGVSVNFLVVAGDGTLSVGQTTTDQQGQASTRLTLGPNPGINTVIAIPGIFLGLPITFTATAISQKVPVLPGNSVVNGASFRPATGPNSGISPGSIISIFGSNLANGFRVASNLPLPTSLLDTSVTFNGIPAPLIAVSEAQINAQVPFEVPVGTVSVEVKRGSEKSEAQMVTVAAVSPGIFTVNQQGTGQGAILISNTAILAAPDGISPGQQARPARRGEFISIFCTALGDVTNRPLTGTPATGTPSVSLAMVTATIGGITVPASFSGLTGFVGLYQVDAQVPSGAATGDAVDVVLDIGGVTSNRVTIAIQ